MRIAPAASSRSISGASRPAAGRSRLILEPASVGKPVTSNRFFTANGTPASGPSGCPCARSRSSASARARARVSVTAVNALSSVSRVEIVASASSTTRAAVIFPSLTARAMSEAEAQFGSMIKP
jgi:hypothetical protein